MGGGLMEAKKSKESTLWIYIFFEVSFFIWKFQSFLYSLYINIYFYTYQGFYVYLDLYVPVCVWCVMCKLKWDMCVCKSVCICVCIYVCMDLCVNMCIYVYICICVSVCVCIYIWVCMYMCECVYACVCVSIRWQWDASSADLLSPAHSDTVL